MMMYAKCKMALNNDVIDSLQSVKQKNTGKKCVLKLQFIIEITCRSTHIDFEVYQAFGYLKISLYID